jgi:hypothetical protein
MFASNSVGQMVTRASLDGFGVNCSHLEWVLVVIRMDEPHFPVPMGEGCCCEGSVLAL